MDDRSWEIYTLSDPRTQQVRYVGISVNAQRRLIGHLKSAKRGTKTHCAHWIRSLIFQGLTPILSVIERGFGKSRVTAEQQWIALYRSAGRLTNLTDGGDGVLGYKASPEARAKMSAAARNISPEHRAKLSVAHKGRPLTAEHRARISVANKGHQVSPETRTKIAAANKGHQVSPETRAKISAGRKGREGSC